MKKILVCVGYFYPHIGGLEKVTNELFQRLAEKDFEIDILTNNTNKSPLYEKIGNLHIYRIPCWNALGGTYPIPLPSFKGYKILSRLLKIKHDVVNTHTRFFITSLIGLVIARIKKIPLIHTEHGSRHSVVSNKIIDIFCRTYDHTLGSLVVTLSKVNIGISYAVGDFLRHLGAQNIEIIPNGINTEFFTKRDSAFRERLGIGTNTVITYIGRLIQGKGVQDLISAFVSVHEKYKNVKLLIVGDGNDRKDLENQALKCGCNGSIIFLGQKDLNEIVEILSITDIFVNPSYSEGLPTSVMEAASVGLPIIATNVGGTQEIIKDGKTGILIEPGNMHQLETQIRYLIENSAYRKELGANARAFVKEICEWEWIVAKTAKLIDQKSLSK